MRKPLRGVTKHKPDLEKDKIMENNSEKLISTKK